MNKDVFQGIARKVGLKPRHSERLIDQIEDIADVKRGIALLKDGSRKQLTDAQIQRLTQEKPYPFGLTSRTNYLFWLRNYVLSSTKTWQNYQKNARINAAVPKMRRLRTAEEIATALALSDWDLDEVTELAKLIRAEEERKRRQQEAQARLEAERKQAEYNTPIYKFTRYSKYLQLGAPYTDECTKILDDLTLEEEEALLDQLLNTKVLGVYFSNDAEGIGSSQLQGSIQFIERHLAKRKTQLKK